MKSRTAIVVYVVAASAFAGALTFALRCADDYRLIKGGRQATGHVVSTNCDVHMSFVYEFSVEGSLFKGKASSASCHHLSAGKRIDVRYLEGQPTTNCVGDPADILRSKLAMIVAGSLLAPLLFVLGPSPFRKKAKDN